MGQKVVRRPPGVKRRARCRRCYDRIELALDLRSAREMGLTIPAAVRLRTDEALERLGSEFPVGALDDPRAGASLGYRATTCLFSAPLIALVNTDASNVTNHPFRRTASASR
jgi:hypothetical protein